MLMSLTMAYVHLHILSHRTPSLSLSPSLSISLCPPPLKSRPFSILKLQSQSSLAQMRSRQDLMPVKHKNMASLVVPFSLLGVVPRWTPASHIRMHMNAHRVAARSKLQICQSDNPPSHVVLSALPRLLEIRRMTGGRGGRKQVKTSKLNAAEKSRPLAESTPTSVVAYGPQ